MSHTPDIRAVRKLAAAPLLLYGVLVALAGLILFSAASAVDIALRAVKGPFVPGWVENVYLTAGTLVWAAIGLSAIDLFVLLPVKRRERAVRWNPPANPGLTVALTAYNDEASIGQAVRDFLSHPAVRRVLVVDNNSADRTAEEARRAGAEVVVETKPGYGHCVYRCLTEGISRTDTELTLLCEGDMTFRAYDIDKFLAYIPHAEIVNGTRIVEQLRERRTQLTTFMYYGNFFVGKLLEAKHIGKGTFTDVGTTYKLCRNDALRLLLPRLNPAINLEFNAHFLDVALAMDLHIVECPVTFHNRVGASKGGNRSNWTALAVGLRMIRGLIFGWREARR
ncbi:MAG: glycosyltransferase [Bryobacteraceae bacterium]|nr:glycosyltransferase [Bryobacteraceae bacterium]